MVLQHSRIGWPGSTNSAEDQLGEDAPATPLNDVEPVSAKPLPGKTAPDPHRDVVPREWKDVEGDDITWVGVESVADRQRGCAYDPRGTRLHKLDTVKVD